eukprot:TRINITY_DN2569_c0_g1_i3.p1 TRINITY_DN2569_c0_g1~~TRINITY_DN2569_c0_g1_i3.p1  ORF type:complete len:798 (+),score=235.49 TRINITY_DN2569_c0_g1_i3:91-2484(+)
MPHDEFIRTIDEGQEVRADSDDDEEDNDLVVSSSRPGSKRLAKKVGFNPGFSFDVEAEKVQPWNFTEAMSTAKNIDKHATLIDEKIKRVVNKRTRAVMEEDDGEDESSDDSDDSDDNASSDDDSSSSDDQDDSSSESSVKGKKNKNGKKGSHSNAGDSDGEVVDEALQKINASTSAFFAAEPALSTVKSKFTDLNLSRRLLKAIDDLGYTKPTPIQARTIPVALMGKDICGNAVTGSGKTAAFLLPILERLLYRPTRINATRVLILLPTRELAVQCQSMCEQLGRYTDIRVCLVVGGLSLKVQETSLRTSPDIVVATPGRMVDHIRNSQSIGLDDIDILVLDEADQLLNLGFSDELGQIVNACPKGRQTLLFSATMTDEVKQLAALSLNQPVRVSVDASMDIVSTLTQEFVRVGKGKEQDKSAMLMSLCSRSFTTKTIVFFNAKSLAHRFKILFGLSGLSATELHGNLTQTQRLAALEDFRDGKVDFLLATDVAARGLDILGVETVINFDMPTNIKQYVHRVGRTARAGKSGRSVTLVCESERLSLKDVLGRNKKAKKMSKGRKVPVESIAFWNEKIKGMEREVRAVLSEERLEKELRVAEMEENKARNMLVHEKEIHSRPARTWFTGKAGKVKAAEAALAAMRGEKVASAAGAEDDGKKGKKKGKVKEEKPKRKKKLTRKQRRALEHDPVFGRDAETGKAKIKDNKTKNTVQALIGKSAKSHYKKGTLSDLAPKPKKQKTKKQAEGAAAGGAGAGAKGSSMFGEEKKTGSSSKDLFRRRRIPSKSGFKSKKKYKRR